MSAGEPSGYRDFALRLRPDGGGGLVLTRPTAQGEHELAPFEPPLDSSQIESLLAQLAAPFAGEQSGVRGVERLPSPERTALLDELPVRLHRALFPPEVAQAYHYELGAASAVQGVGVRLRLILDPADPACRPWCALPWELLAAPREMAALALNPLRAVVRSLPVSGSPRTRPSWPSDQPLRVLLLGASPLGQAPLNLAAEVQAIREQAPALRFELVEPATAADLRRALDTTRAHVLHFLGHGDLEGPAGRGRLLFARGDGGGEDWVDSRELGTWLVGLDHLLLVVVNACRGAEFARSEGVDAWSGVAQELVRLGVPAVVAHQRPISDRAAIAFSGGFYRQLAAGHSVEAAVAEGRQAISQACRRSLEWATPVLYQQEVGPLLPAPSRWGLGLERLDQSWLLRARTQGFVGREWAFHRIERFLTELRECAEGGYLEVLGDPGIGKTSLLAEAVRRRGWIHHFALRNSAAARAATCLQNLSQQILDRFGLPHELAPATALQAPERFEQLLTKVAERVDPEQGPLVIVVDALDEAEELLRGNALGLPSFLPRGIVLLVSSRRVARELEVRCRREKLDIDALSTQNGADIAAYLRRRLPHPGITSYRSRYGYDEQAWLDLLTEKSEGNFMYLSCVLIDMESRGAESIALAELPVGLHGYYEQHWARMRASSEVRFEGEILPVVEVLAAAQAPLALEQIARRARSLDGLRVVAVLRELRPFLETSVARDDAGAYRLYRFYHASFRDFLNEQDEVFSLRRGHEETLRHLGES